MSDPRPLRIACLHGYLQNASRFRLKTSGLRKALERPPPSSTPLPKGNRRSSDPPLAELVYIDAPFIVDKLQLSDDSSADPDSVPAAARERAVFSPHVPVETGASGQRDRTYRSWWSGEGRTYNGWERSFEFLRAKFAEKQFDGILGFSQGAVAASLICGARQRSPDESPFSSLRFAILISGFASRADEYASLYEAPIELPSMHAWGLRDKTVPPEASEKLMHLFGETGRESLEHPNGHLVPQDAASRHKVVEYVKQFRKPDGELVTRASL